jgi:phosphonoacetaldehyde hydrolase
MQHTAPATTPATAPAPTPAAVSTARDRLSAVVFDWAGTILDYGSCAPMGAFVRLFEQFGITISIAQARGPMGLAKWDHIQALTRLPDVAAQWETKYGHLPTEADVDRLYEVFTPLNAAVVPDFAAFIPGALEAVAAVRARGLKVGSTTGYNRPIMEVVTAIAAKGGYVPDNLVCAGDQATGRPTPLMMWRCFADLGICWPATVVKVDDTEVGIEEGVNAGSWAVGVAVSGNAMGLPLAEWQALAPAEQASRRAEATAKLRAAGAHYVVDSVADLPPVLDAIAERLARGELPR